MKGKFTPHLDYAKEKWEKYISPGSVVLDATCGNGYDTLFLAQNVLTYPSGKVFALDIQKKAIENTKKLLITHIDKTLFKRIAFFHNSHENIQKIVGNISFSLIVYNLGYLPKGDKSITTQKEITLKSISSSLSLLQEKGAISIICYPGHLEGLKEEKALIKYFSSLNSSLWSICYHKWINRHHSPSFLWIEKI